VKPFSRQEFTVSREKGALAAPEQKKAPAGEEQRALLAREGLKSSQSPAGATRFSDQSF